MMGQLTRVFSSWGMLGLEKKQLATSKFAMDVGIGIEFATKASSERLTYGCLKRSGAQGT